MPSDNQLDIIADSKDREAWIEARKTFIGASEVGACMGLNKWVTPHMVWREKAGLYEREQTLAMEMGLFLEPFIIAKGVEMARSKGWEISDVAPNSLTFRGKKPFYGATPDAFGIFRGERCSIQTKFANDYMSDEFGQEGSDQCPDQYVAQVVWEMSVCKCRYGFLFVLLSNRDIAVYFFDGSPGEVGEDLRQLVALAQDKVNELWQHVLDGTEPPFTGYEADTKYLKEHYSYEDGSIVNADQELAESVLELQRTRSRLEKDRFLEEELANRVRAFMGEAAILETPSGDITWKADKNGKRSLRVPKLKEVKDAGSETLLV